MEENVKKKTIISKILMIYTIVQMVLSIILTIARSILVRKFGNNLYQYWQSSIWGPLSKILLLVPIFMVLPFLILSIIGMVKEKRDLSFIIFIILSFVAWFMSFVVYASFL